MSKTLGWMIGIAAAVCVMGGIHAYDSYEARHAGKLFDLALERERGASELLRGLERYRRTSSTFRTGGDPVVTAAKHSLQSAVNGATELLAESGHPGVSAQERESGEALRKRLGDFLVTSTRLEPMLFSRDVFVKEEARNSFNQIVTAGEALREGARQVQASLDREGVVRTKRLDVAMAGSGIVALALLVIGWVSLMLGHDRPLSKLAARAKEVRGGEAKSRKNSRLKGRYKEVEAVLDELAANVDAQRKERQQFVTSVASDLRVPLVPLQTSAAMLADSYDRMSPLERDEAAGRIRGASVWLGRTLDDLADTMAVDHGGLRLDETIVDLREPLGAVAEAMSLPGSAHDVRANMPSLPVWALVDPRRLERVLVQLVSKIMQYRPQGGRIDLSLLRSTRGGKQAGAEITIHEGGRDSANAVRVSSPEQSVSRHWIASHGFGLTLAQRIVEAHGGTINAAGMPGLNVQLTLRLPEERLASASSAVKLPE